MSDMYWRALWIIRGEPSTLRRLVTSKCFGVTMIDYCIAMGQPKMTGEEVTVSVIFCQALSVDAITRARGANKYLRLKPA